MAGDRIYVVGGCGPAIGLRAAAVLQRRVGFLLITLKGFECWSCTQPDCSGLQSLPVPTSCLLKLRMPEIVSVLGSHVGALAMNSAWRELSLLQATFSRGKSHRL